MSDFYLTLHSDQTTMNGVKNTASCFKVYLGHELLLPGKWEVGLAEIFYPLTMIVMSAEEAVIHVETTHAETGQIESKKDIKIGPPEEGLVAFDSVLLGTMLRESVKNAGINIYMQGDGRVRFVSDKSPQKVSFSDKMRQLLGFTECSYDLKPYVQSLHGFNVKRVLPSQFYVSTDLIHHQLVGGTYDQILRSVHIDYDKYEYDCMGHARFDNIQYYTVDHHKIDDVGIYIKDRYGKCLSFASGESTVILHFRKVLDG